MRWDTVIGQKTNEVGQFLTGKRLSLDFVEPVPKLERQDNDDLRARVPLLTQSEARKLGIEKSTLHYLRMNARKKHALDIYRKTRKRLQVAVLKEE